MWISLVAFVLEVVEFIVILNRDLLILYGNQINIVLF